MRFRQLVLLPLLLLAGCAASHQWHGSPYQDPQPAPAIELPQTDGQLFQLDDQRGKAVLLYFGYTHCPDICPATLADLAWVNEQLDEETADLQIVFISIDPGRDQPAATRRYLDRFDARFLGLVGTEDSLEPIKSSYGVLAQRDSEVDDNYTMTHTSRVFLIDPDGILRTNYTFDEPRESILADLEYLLEN